MRSRLALVFVALFGNSIGALAFLGLGGTGWTEDALLHDGRVLQVHRMVERGGRHEIGQKPPYREQRLEFRHPTTGEKIVWNDVKSEDIGAASFLAMLVDVVDNTPYLVATPAGCLSYNKWGRPNPPYVVFRYGSNRWERISLEALPKQIVAFNLLSSAPDVEVERLRKSHITVADIKHANADFRQVEYKLVLRTEVPAGSYGSSVNCDELVYYKGAWVGPGDSIGKRMMDARTK